MGMGCKVLREKGGGKLKKKVAKKKHERKKLKQNKLQRQEDEKSNILKRELELCVW
jgi:hypothetical protein